MEKGTFDIGPVRNLIVLGAPLFVSEIETLCRKHGAAAYFITASDQKSALSQMPERLLVTDTLSDEKVDRFLDFKRIDGSGNTLALSFGARWIIKSDLSQKLFDGKLLNAHGTRLPLDRGGGGFTWRIMRGDRIGNLLLHVIDDGIDTGPIIESHDYVIPAHLRIPADINNDYRERLKQFIIGFLEKTMTGRQSFIHRHQPDYLSSYFPRIATETHGFIDWRWEPIEIERFIMAFDDPYPGARTLWKDQTVIVKSAQIHVGESGHHPFQSGLVTRNNGRWLTVALKNEYSLIVERIMDESGVSLLSAIREGDRLHTPSVYLEKSMSERVVIGPKGVVKKS